MKITVKQTALASLASMAMVLGLGSAFFPSVEGGMLMSRASGNELVGHSITFSRDASDDNSYPSSGQGTYVFGSSLPGGTYIYSYTANSYTASTAICSLKSNKDTTLLFSKNKSGTSEFLFQSINSITVNAENTTSGGFTLVVQYSINGKTFNDYNVTEFAKDSSTKSVTVSASTLSDKPILKIRLQNAHTNDSLRISSIDLNLNCSYSYVEPIYVDNVTLNKSSTTLSVGNTETLVATVDGAGIFDDSVTWTSSDSTVASVNQNGVVTGVATGSATITATSNYDSNYSASCTVTVKELSSITIKTAPTKTIYSEGDNFDPTGLVITLHYSDSSTSDLSYLGNETEFEFSKVDNLQSSDTSITVTYGGQSCNQSITVSSGETLHGSYSATFTVSSTSTTHIIDFDNMRYYTQGSTFVQFFTFELDSSGNMLFTYDSTKANIDPSGTSRRLFIDSSTPNATGKYTEDTDSFTITLYFKFVSEKSESRTFTKVA